MRSHLRRAAFSLIEAIFATFLLLSAVLLGAYVFHSGLRAEASNEKRVVACMLAETAMADIRRAADRDFPRLVAAYDGREWSDPEEADMTVKVAVRPMSLALVCEELESQYDPASTYPAPQARLMDQSAYEVEVVVSWSDPAPVSIRVLERVTNLSTASEFKVHLLNAGGGAAPESMPLAALATAEFSAKATADGQPVEDIQFTWFVQPLIGFGHLPAVSRDGSRCTYQNAYRNYNDELRFAPGACYLMLKATYQGRESTARIRIDNEA